MIRLVRVELTRLLWRRAVVLLLVACVVVPALILLSVVISVETASDAYYRAVLDLDSERGGSAIAVILVLGISLFLLGTTFVGHDWNTGSMSNQLLFEPRRLRVWGAKALAVTLAAGVTAFVVLTAYWLVLDLLVSAGDYPEPRSGALLDGLQQGWRGAGLATVAALGGYVVTMLSRSTVFTVGALFAVAVASGLLLASVGPRDPGWLDPSTNAAAVIDNGVTYYVEPDGSCFDRGPGYSARSYLGDECSTQGRRSGADGATYYGVLLLAAGGASALSFRRRDVP